MHFQDHFQLEVYLVLLLAHFGTFATCLRTRLNGNNNS